VEGKNIANAYRWKDTVGDVAQRRQNWNRWQDAVSTKAPHYHQTYGLGFFEFFQLCEDLGAEPVPILNCGMSCQYQDKQFVPLTELDEWVQDALDLVEFANGPPTSRWGAVRASMGHPGPFNMKYLGVGNEQWGDPYFERYAVFQKALKERYPDLVLVTTSGPGVDDQWWDLAWDKFKAGTPAEIVDEHYYRPPQWFLDHAARYDRYDRNGPRVFAGEFAAHDRDRGNNLRSAVTEAAFMTGLWRNADIVRMACYAPLLAKEGFTQWRPDLIWFDNTRVYGSPSYHVQKLFGRNRPDEVLPVNLTQPATRRESYPGMIGVGTWNTAAEFKDIRVTRDGQTLFESDFSQGMSGWNTARGQWETVDGALRQTAEVENARAIIGDLTWSDYTLELKARKLSGREGFLIIFQSPGDQTTTWWNIGGWGNREHGLDLPGVNEPHVPGQIDIGRWYDIRVELKCNTIKASLDGQLIHEAHRVEPDPLYVAAGRNRERGDLVLALVNAGSSAVEANVDLQGVNAVEPEANLTILTSAGLDDENSFATPDKVAPRASTIHLDGPRFRHQFEPHSVNFLRISTRN
jgi:alpha-L-arabinofuranosidase